MKNVAINFKINSLFLFLFFLLGVIATTFGQTVELPLLLKAQPYGEQTLAEFTARLTEKGGIKMIIKNEAGLGEVLALVHGKRKMAVTMYDFTNFSDMPDVNPADTSLRIELFFKPADRYDFYLKTTEGITSFTIIKEGDVFYEVLNGKIMYAYNRQKFIPKLNGKSEDYFKDKIDWQYTPEAEGYDIWVSEK